MSSLIYSSIILAPAGLLSCQVQYAASPIGKALEALMIRVVELSLKVNVPPHWPGGAAAKDTAR